MSAICAIGQLLNNNIVVKQWHSVIFNLQLHLITKQRELIEKINRCVLHRLAHMLIFDLSQWMNTQIMVWEEKCNMAGIIVLFDYTSADWYLNNEIFVVSCKQLNKRYWLLNRLSSTNRTIVVHTYPHTHTHCFAWTATLTHEMLLCCWIIISPFTDVGSARNAN